MGYTGYYKKFGRMGSKEHFFFSKALAAKSVWRLITIENLWTQVVNHKHIRPHTIHKWLRIPSKKVSLTSIIWKSMVLYFDVIGDGLVWRVGDGNKLCLGKDPWMGSGGAHLLLDPLIQSLQEKGLVYHA